MANSIKMAAVLLAFLQVSYCAVSQLVDIPAGMTVNGFQQGEGGGGPAACDGQFHSDEEYIVSLSSVWFQGGARCGKEIRIQFSATQYTVARVMDECRDCTYEVGASSVIWRALQVDPSLGEVFITWSDWS